MAQRVVEGVPLRDVQAWIYDLLDSIKTFDEDMLKEWVKATWEDPKEVYGE